MAIKETLQKVIAQLSGDNAEALKQELRQVLTEVDTLTESKLQVDGESKNRKERLRALESELQTAKEDLEKAKASEPELQRLKLVETEYKTHKQSIYQTKLNDWKTKQEKLKVKETDKNYDKYTKLLSKFNIFEEGKELTDEQLTNNLNQYALLEEAGIFTEVQTGKPSPAGIPAKGAEGGATNSGEALWKT